MTTPNLRSFDRVANVYDETRSAPPQVAAAVTEALLRVLHEVSDSPRLLEVGIGTGRIAVPLVEAGVRVTGIDISTKMLDVLRSKRADIDVLFAEAAHPPFRAAAFDAALFVHILHLVPDVAATVRESRRVVRSGGVLVRVSDDHDERGYHLNAGRVTWDVVEEITGVARPPGQSSMANPRLDPHVDSAAIFKRVVEEHGAAVQEQILMRYDYPFNAREAIDHLRRRDFSSSWLIPEGALDDVVAAVERRFEELWGDLNANHPAQKTVGLNVARLP
jgi:SAM-dependent methyltransferase